MPWVARKKSVNGIYHIMLRDINTQTVLEGEEEYENFFKYFKNAEK